MRAGCRGMSERGAWGITSTRLSRLERANASGVTFTIDAGCCVPSYVVVASDFCQFDGKLLSIVRVLLNIGSNCAEFHA